MSRLSVASLTAVFPQTSAGYSPTIPLVRCDQHATFPLVPASAEAPSQHKRRQALAAADRNVYLGGTSGGTRREDARGLRWRAGARKGGCRLTTGSPRRPLVLLRANQGGIPHASTDEGETASTSTSLLEPAVNQSEELSESDPNAEEGTGTPSSPGGSLATGTNGSGTKEGAGEEGPSGLVGGIVPGLGDDGASQRRVEAIEGISKGEGVKGPPDSALVTGPASWMGAYEDARRILTQVGRQVARLEAGLLGQEQDLSASTRKIDEMLSNGVLEEGAVLRDAEEKVRSLELEAEALERANAAQKEEREQLQGDYDRLQEKLASVEAVAAEAVVLRKVIVEKEEENQALRQDLAAAAASASALSERVQTAEEALAARDALVQQLQQESLLSSSALQQAARAMNAARDRTLHLEEQLEETGDLLSREQQKSNAAREQNIQLSMDLGEAQQEVREREAQLAQLAEEAAAREQQLAAVNEEAEATRRTLALTEESLEEARRAVEALKAAEAERDEALAGEMASATQAVKEAGERERELRAAESAARELQAQVAALKSEVGGQEALLAELRGKAAKGAQAGEQLAQRQKELEQLRVREAQLGGQVAVLEEEVSAREQLLEDIREQTRSSTEALQMAANYKRELNAVREAEAELREALEAKEAELEELQEQLASGPGREMAEEVPSPPPPKNSSTSKPSTVEHTVILPTSP
eukprot:TRINITY_DN6379_c0_g1_i1.p1 TRINITY_DN6379_c0_g1~~TRINITY_DN6379_c0_g1_i1.p1  ORF type:complete len:706 (-),score=232.29 TRINITY_DN6379_c0_g1_i1:36-2153(-)